MNYAICSLHCFCFAVELVAETFDVVHSVCYDDCVLREVPFYGGGEGCSSVFFGTSCGIDIAIEAKIVVIDVDDFETFVSGFLGGGDFVGEVLDELGASRGFAAGGIFLGRGY